MPQAPHITKVAASRPTQQSSYGKRAIEALCDSPLIRALKDK